MSFGCYQIFLSISGGSMDTSVLPPTRLFAEESQRLGRIKGEQLPFER